jgi:ribosomal protein L11 methyltransferase
MDYLRRVFRVPAAVEEDAVAVLWEAGTLGVEVEPAGADRVRLVAWFAAGAPPVERAALPAGTEPLGEEGVPEEDWMAPYRERARPFELGRAFVADPREPEPGTGHGAGAETAAAGAGWGGRHWLRLPARGAFGTGSHESTRLALELLEEAGVEGRRVLDVGTGTGVLAFAALALGARSAVAFDSDPVAAFHARENSALNGLDPRLYAGRIDALAPAGGGFDLVVVNVIPERIVPELPRVAAQLAPGGELIVSGMLTADGPRMLDEMAALGLAERSRRTAGEWLGLRAGRA